MRKQALRAVAASAVAVVGVGAAGGLVDGASASTDPSPAAWAALRNCESGGNYATDTGNGYYGAYQFSQQTWEGLGYSGLPSNAAPSTQDQAALQLYSQDGSAPWPVCGAFLSSTTSSASSTTTTTSASSTTTTTSAAPGEESATTAETSSSSESTVPEGGGTLYTVQAGDTLWVLSLRFGTTVDALVGMNHIADPNLIFVGQTLVV